MSMLDSVSKVMNNINYLKQISTKYPDLGLTGNYYNDISQILHDFLVIKEQYLLLLQASGQDDDRLTVLTVENTKLLRENTVLKESNQNLEDKLDSLYKIIIE